ncbi:putative calcium-binding protein C800.10c [Camellia lanceoleosa]|uniref:Calcium-binding protein C800.10c n=1 Tax=Camellia lanceoleosa TaxID=1840588 RepID=A0ACC0GRF4_9ERIC|nr:putative calcium-binding protein C800.10c [Camellia lanceoleosa]
MDQFELYFQRADLDRDGRISGAEAVAFFQGSNLPKQVLAQIWMHADQARTGFLGKAEFYNALKLVTVAQSKRELTPDIVKAALHGPASAKIPAPQINLAATPAPHLNSIAAAPTPQMGPVAPQIGTARMGPAAPTASQTLGFRGQVPPNATMNQQYFPSQGNQSLRPPLPQSSSNALRPPQGVASPDFSRGGSVAGPALPNSVTANNWLGGRMTGVSTGASHVPNQGVSQSMSSTAAKPQDPFLSASAKDSKATVGSGNGFSSDPVFGGDVFSAAQSLSKHDSPTYSVSSAPASSAIVPVSTGLPSSSKPDPFAFDSLQTLTRQPTGNQQQHTQALVKPNQQVSTQTTSSFASSGISVGPGNSTPNQSLLSWPKMTPAGIQKYTKVFVEVDTDRDGKITGEQARNLFLSWRLPREVLKQVWDLSDQDNDSMLSLREFCVALYLMERFREGRPLPPTLPSNILLDETLLSLTGQPNASYGNVARGPTAGFRPQQGMPGARPVASAAGMRPPVPGMFPQADGTIHFDQQKARMHLMESSHGNQLSNGEQNTVDTESAETEKKVEDKDKVYLDSKEKIEFYRSKMQDLVLYKSRCENRLNEITERAIADKREAELLGKKYEEKYKQVAETASKLTIEEAAFREIQERKMELQQAITKMEQGGSADGILQVRADRIQSDLEELTRAFTERCKKHGIDIKSTAVIELPTGWQPGIPEISSVWDEDWDKFEDEGFLFDVAMPPKTKSTSAEKENYSPNGSLSPDLMSHADDDMSDKLFSKGERAFESESAYTHSEDESGKSPSSSPARHTAFESPSREYSDNHFKKSPEADAETHGSFDEPSWGTFDNNDDVDSVWGFNPSNPKDSDHEKHGEKYFFGSSDMGASPRTDSPQSDSMFRKKSPFAFDDSVPGSPLSRAGNSPRYGGGSTDQYFDNLSRFDSFSMHDQSFSPRKETLSRFDSINSTRSFDHNNQGTFSRFDSINSTRGVDHSQGTHTRFDSMSSSRGFDHRHGGFSSFDDADPFGSSGPFKVSSLESQTPKKGSESWSSF